MIYFYDMGFIVTYMTVKEMARRIYIIRPLLLPVQKKLYWVEYTLILLYMYLKPDSTDSERMVSFCICMATMLVYDLVITRHKRL